MSGTLTGLPGGQFALLLVSLSYGGCEDVVETGVMRGRYCQGLEISANGSENVTIYQAK